MKQRRISKIKITHQSFANLLNKMLLQKTYWLVNEGEILLKILLRSLKKLNREKLQGILFLIIF
jgi:hypothetical protein